jgi:hypothetical protein
MPVRADMNRRRLVRLMGSVAVAMLAPAPLYAQSGQAVTVYKEPTCGCCGGWVRHMTKAGFAVTALDVSNIGAIKTKFGIPDALATCHTAEVEGYLVEGHVPAVVVERLLRERPKAKGVAVPGMPLGAPGMENPLHETYEVILFGDNGQSVFVRCRGTEES